MLLDCKYLVQEVSEVCFLVYNTTPKNNLSRNFYNRMLLNCKFFVVLHAVQRVQIAGRNITKKLILEPM